MLGYGDVASGLWERGTLALAAGHFRRSEGQTVVEYALILTLLALAVVIVVTALSGDMSTLFSTVGNDL